MNVKDKPSFFQQIGERATMGALADHALARKGTMYGHMAANSSSLLDRVRTNDIDAPYGAGRVRRGDTMRFARNGADALDELGKNQRREDVWGSLSGVDQVLQDAGEILFGTAVEARAEGHGGWADGLALASEQLALHARGESRAAGSPWEIAKAMSDLAQALPHLEGDAKKAALLGVDALSQGMQNAYFGPTNDLLATLFGGGATPGQLLPFGAMDFQGFAPIEQAFSAGFAHGMAAGGGYGMGGDGFGILDNPFFAGAFPAMPDGLLYAAQGDYMRAVGMLI